MKLKTKFDIGDTVYAVSANEECCILSKETVRSIVVEKDTYWYVTENGYEKPSDCYPTMLEAVKALEFRITE